MPSCRVIKGVLYPFAKRADISEQRSEIGDKRIVHKSFIASHFLSTTQSVSIFGVEIMDIETASYEVVSTKRITRDLLGALFNNVVGAIRVPNFVSVDMCKLAINGIQEHGIGYYDNVYPKIGRIGITQNEHKNKPQGKLEYFDKVPLAHKAREHVLRRSGDFLYSVMNFIQTAWGRKVSLAFEESLDQEYFAGLVRVINRALLHFDWAKYDGRGWAIEKTSAQLSWNIFLQTGYEGGATSIYQRFWQEADEHLYRIPGSYNFDHKVIEGCASVEISPALGDLVLFNSRNFHEVQLTKGEEERITISSFIGLLESKKDLIFWS